MTVFFPYICTLKPNHYVMKRLLTITFMCLMTIMQIQAQATQKEISVASAREFIDALGSNRTIIIKEGCELNLTPILNNKELFRRAGYLWTNDYYEERETAGELKVSCNRFDGRQLDLIGLRNLTIRGGNGCRIIVEPRYAYIMSFYRCSNIRLERLTLGHTEEGYCEGGVINAVGSENISIANCDLYGCGTYGLETDRCKKVTMERSIIRDCSYGIMQIANTEDCVFTDCDFVRCREFNLIAVANSTGTRFTRCRFAQNKGELFDLDSPIRVESCEIHHPKDQRQGNIDSEYFGYGDQNTTWYRDDEPLLERSIGPAYAVKPQQKATAQQVLADIRKKYAQVKQRQEERKKAELPPDETVVTSNYMAAGGGPAKDVTHYYYSGDFDEDLGREIYKVYFMVRKYNVGANDFYQEFLYDDKGSLIFYFEKSGTNETRYYWSADGLVKEDIKGERLTDEAFACRLSYELKNAFNLLMNREF